MQEHCKWFGAQQVDLSEERLNQRASAALTVHNLPLLIRSPFKQGSHIFSRGWGGLEEVDGNLQPRRLRLTEQLINLNATISGTTSIWLRLSRRLFISLSEIGWRIRERLVGGRKPAASVPSGGTDVPGTIWVFQGKKEKKAFTVSKLNEAVYAREETQTFSSDIMTQILPVCNCWRPGGCCNSPLFHLDAAAQQQWIIGAFQLSACSIVVFSSGFEV